MRFRRRRQTEDAELNITSFMNLMIVLVPVLLLSMVFSRITVLELNLPDSAASSMSTDEQNTHDFLEVVIYPGYLGVITLPVIAPPLFAQRQMANTTLRCCPKPYSK